jgi:hypothetical protein
VTRSGMVLAAFLAGGCGEPLVVAPPSFDGPPAATVPSVSGHLSITVWTSPWPPIKGSDAVRFEIVDGAGVPLEQAALTASAWMPAHGHGSSVMPRATERGAGIYDVDGLLFYMSGRWEVRAEIVDAAGAADALTAMFDVN